QTRRLRRRVGRKSENDAEPEEKRLADRRPTVVRFHEVIDRKNRSIAARLEDGGRRQKPCRPLSRRRRGRAGWGLGEAKRPGSRARSGWSAPDARSLRRSGEIGRPIGHRRRRPDYFGQIGRPGPRWSSPAPDTPPRSAWRGYLIRRRLPYALRIPQRL